MDKMGKTRSQYAILIWRGINAVMSLFFILCSIVQFNDPDPYLWVPFYAIPSCLCACIVWMPEVVENLIWRIAVLLHLAISFLSFIVLFVQMIYYFREIVINPLRYEEGRELLGVVITMSWILICRFCNPKRSEQQVGAVMLMVVIVGLLPFGVWIASCLAEYHHCTDMW